MTVRHALRTDGPVFLPGDEGYDLHRKPLNPALDPHPAVVVRAAGTDDVRRAVLAARRHGLPFAVQATGHGTHVAHDGALLLDTGAMASVLIDPARRVARVGPGARWGDVLRAAAPFGLAGLSGSSPDVGVIGYTLGGGLGAEADATVELRHWGGRIARDAGAAAHRDAPLSVVLDTVPSARTAAALRRCGLGSSFLNFLPDPSRTASAFTAANWAALRRIKAAYDPDHVFAAGLAVPPAAKAASA